MTWLGTPTEYEQQAHEYHLEAKREYRRARTDARRAAAMYALAAHERQQVRWLNRRPDMWEHDGGPFDPAAVERNAAAAVRLADLYLRGSFRSTERSRECRKYAGRAERAAKAGRARIAETEAQMAVARACVRDSSWYAESERWDRCLLCDQPWSWHRDANGGQS
jgi:hypothetical protein